MSVYINYYIKEFDSDLTDLEVDLRPAFEPETAYLEDIAQKCAEDYFYNDRMDDCRSVTIRFSDPYSDELWHEFEVDPDYAVHFVAIGGSHKPLTKKDVLGEEI